jgi:hypothetical protein
MKQRKQLRITTVGCYPFTSLQNRRCNDYSQDLLHRRPTASCLPTPTLTECYGQQLKGHNLVPSEQKANELLAYRQVVMEKLGIEPRTFSTQHVP